MAKEIYHALSDPRYQEPFVDVEEMRSRVLLDGMELAYRYVHGGFTGTNVKFSFCFPRRDAYKGRFFQYLSPFPGPDEELASLNKCGADDMIGFSLLNGAYFVESNMGSVAMFGPNGDDTDRWKSSAAVAEYSRKMALEIYGGSRPVGIVFRRGALRDRLPGLSAQHHHHARPGPACPAQLLCENRGQSGAWRQRQYV